MLFKEAIAVYNEKHKKTIDTKYRFNYQTRWDMYLPEGFKV
jgi:hypothetical protein